MDDVEALGWLRSARRRWLYAPVTAQKKTGRSRFSRIGVPTGIRTPVATVKG